jgi:polar amino acid transport system substrate-binding protein
VTKHSSLLRFTVAVALVATLGASACSSSKKSSSSTGGSTDSAAVALLPASFKSAGELKIGTDASYAPNEYRDANNKIVGFDIDLMNAIAARLGLKTSYENGQFDSLIASIAGGKYDAGISSFTDKKEREAVVDFVTYYNDGTQWAATKGKAVDPDNACGLKVAVESGTTQADDVTARSKVCTDGGKPAITVDKYDTQDRSTPTSRWARTTLKLPTPLSSPTRRSRARARSCWSGRSTTRRPTASPSRRRTAD